VISAGGLRRRRPRGLRYDANGNRTILTDPDGKVTRYRYDALNRVITLSNAGGTSEYRYDRSSLLSETLHPNGSRAEQSYDGAGRIRHIDNLQGTAVVTSYDYQLDANGNRTRQVETSGGAEETTTYGYDLADRLQSVAYPAKTTTYTYDGAYNRLTERSTDGSGTVLEDQRYGYDSRNQLRSITDNLDAAQSISYSYDANGNQTLKSKNGSITTFVYDARDKLVSVQENSTTLGLFRYDYAGRRIEKDLGGQIVRTSYDGDSALIQYDSNGDTLARYDYGPQRLASLEQVSEGRQYYLFDGLGSVSALTNAAGTLQARYQYDAWGNERQTAGSSFNRFGYTGHEKDNETGLYYFKARFYDPDTGRFLNQDAYLGDINTPPSLHRYLYAYANPTRYTDPTGNVPVLDEWGQFHTDTAAKLIDEAENTDSIAAAAGLGFMAGANYVVGGVVETVNFGLNIIGSDGWLGEGARERATTELHQAFDTINTIVEDPKGTGTAIVTGVKETAKAALRGETKAIAQSVAVGTGMMTVRPNANVGSVAAGVSNTAKNLAVRTGDAMRNTAKAVTQAAEEGRFNPLNYQLEAGTLGMNGGPLKFKGAANNLVRTSLPDLPKTFAREFEGQARFRTFKSGERVYRSPWIPDEVPSSPGSWFGTRRTATQAGTDSMYQIGKWNNPNKVLRTYELTQDVTVYYGRVKGGTGYQALFPKEVNPGDVLKFIEEAPLK